VEGKMGEQQLTSNNKREILNKAFDFMLPALPVFVGNTLQKRDKNHWWQNYVLNKLQSNTVRDLPRNGTNDEYINQLDISLCIKIIIQNWQDIFKHIIRDIKFSWVHELIEIRNDVSHWTNDKSTSYTFESISHTLDTMILFMRSINNDVAEQIAKIKQGFENKYKEEKNATQDTEKETTEEVKNSKDIKYDRDYWEKKSSSENFALVNEIMKLINKIDKSLELSYNQQRYIGIKRNDEPWNFIKIIPQKKNFRIKFSHPENGLIDDIIKKNNFKAKYDAKEDGKGKEDRYWIDLNKNVINEKKETLKDLIDKSYNYFKK
jgi:hypothetical protein